MPPADTNDARAEREAIAAMGRELDDLVAEVTAAEEARAEARMSPAARAARDARDKELDDLLGDLDDLGADTDDDQSEHARQHDFDNAPANLPQPSTTTETGAKSSANFPQNPRRRSQTRDQKSLATMRLCGLTPVSDRTGDFSVGTPTPSSPSLHTPTYPSTDSDSHSSNVTADSTTHDPIHAWGDTGDVAKITTANHALADLGRAYEASINLGPDVIAAARASKKGFNRYITDRLQKAFKRIGCHKVVLVIDDKEGREHIHAGIALDPDLSAKDKAAKKAILEEAAGEWGNPKGKQFQVSLKPQRNLDHFARYMLSKIPHARKAIQGNPVYISNPLRKLAQQRWEHSRAVINEQFRAPPPALSLPPPASPPEGLIMFAATRVDHSPHSSPVASAGLAGVRGRRQALRHSSGRLPVGLSRRLTSSLFVGCNAFRQVSCHGL